MYIRPMLFQYCGTQNKVFKHLIYYILEHIDVYCFTGKGIRSGKVTLYWQLIFYSEK